MQHNVNLFFLDTFYRLCSEYVEHYPKTSLECKRMQSFAAIESYDDLNSPNLGKTLLDRDKPFFFSRQWAASKYNPSKLSAKGPTMTAFEESGIFVNPFDHKTKAYYNIQIAFIDKLDPLKSSDDRECSKRTRNDIFVQSEVFARNFFSYLSNVSYFTDIGFKNVSIAAEKYPDAVEDVLITRQFIKMLKEDNKQINHSRWEGNINDYFGTYVTIKLRSETCDEFIYDAANKEYRLGFDRNCCE